MSMRLSNLTIRRGYGYKDDEDVNRYYAEVTYENSAGCVKMAMDPDVSESLLLVIGQAITKFAHRAAQEVESNLIQSYHEAKQLPTIEAEKVTS